MSIENCARHQEAHDAFNARDLDLCVSYMTEDCSIVDCGRDMSMTGRSEMKEWLQGWVDMVDGHVTDRSYLDAGDYTICMFSGTGKGPKGEVEGPYCEVAHWTGDKIDSMRLYYDQLQLLVKMGVMEAPVVASM